MQTLSCSLYTIQLRLGVLGRQDLRTAYAFFHQKCSLEGWEFYVIFVIEALSKCHSKRTGLNYNRSGSWTGGDGAWVELSGKMHVLARLLAHLRHKTDDRIVLVSNYTQVISDNLE